MPAYIILTGRRASGKDVFSEYVFRKYGIPSIRFSTVIKEMGVELGLIPLEEKEDKAAQQRAGNALRSKYGERYYTKKLAQKIFGKSYSINGARYPLEVDYLREIFGDTIVLVGIVSDEQKRYERAKDIGLVSSYGYFLELESNLAEVWIDTLIQKADIIISNNDTMEAFYKNIDMLMNKIKTD